MFGSRSGCVVVVFRKDLVRNSFVRSEKGSLSTEMALEDKSMAGFGVFYVSPSLMLFLLTLMLRDFRCAMISFLDIDLHYIIVK